MDPFRIRVSAEITLNEFCWEHALPVEDVRAANASETDRPSVIDELQGTDRIPMGTVVKLPPSLQNRGGAYGHYFDIGEFGKRRDAVENALASWAHSSGVPPPRIPRRSIETPEEQLVAALVKHSALQEQALPAQGSASGNKSFYDSVDTSALKEEIAELDHSFFDTDLVTLKHPKVMAEPPRKRRENYLSDKTVQTVADSTTPGPIDIQGSSTAVHFSMLEPVTSSRVKEEWVFLGQQGLGTLIDSIECPMYDLPYPQVKNAILFIGGTFFVDDRHHEAADRHETVTPFEDLSEVIRTWDPFGTGAVYGDCPVMMVSETRIADLHVKMGEMCVFRHMGVCDHYFFVNDVNGAASDQTVTQLATPDGFVDPAAFPRRIYLGADRVVMCDVCAQLPATVMTYWDKLMPRNPTVFCMPCFHMTHCDDNGDEVNDGYVKYILPEGKHF